MPENDNLSALEKSLVRGGGDSPNLGQQWHQTGHCHNISVTFEILSDNWWISVWPNNTCNFKTQTSAYIRQFKGVVDWFFSRLDCVYGVQSSMCSCLFFLKTHYFSHNLLLFNTALSLLWQTPQFISWFYEAPPSEIRDGLRLVSWLSVLWFAKPPVCVWTSRPSPQWHVLQLNCKQ